MDGLFEKDSGMTCCFCNKSIIVTNLNPCDINIMTNWDKPNDKQKNQTFWYHLECVWQKIHPDIQQHFIVDLL